jgi:hypothetical protein
MVFATCHYYTSIETDVSLIGISKFNYWQMESEMLFTNCWTARNMLCPGETYPWKLTLFLNSASL